MPSKNAVHSLSVVRGQGLVKVAKKKVQCCLHPVGHIGHEMRDDESVWKGKKMQCHSHTVGHGMK